MINIIVAIITAILSPIVLFLLQMLKERRDGMSLRIRRLEILTNIMLNPEDKQTIHQLFDDYKKHGGNSYVAERVAEWEAKYENKRRVVKR